jgi:hypothetical protein
MRSCVTDPRGEWPLHTSWSPLRTFEVVAVPDGSADGSDGTEVSDGSEPPPDDGTAVKMEPPVRRLEESLLLWQYNKYIF